ncbi:uncharacterized protein JCM10292_006915 [Rhodotorula paludigena]|uniref:uncharacterized protein n=1 Tax=Rhodotorula paludigena TaxID=86838 RepID=UPI00316C9A63
MPVPASQPLPSLDELRQRSQDELASLRADEYGIRNWTRAAQSHFSSAEKAWAVGRSTNDAHKMAEAFLEFRRAAGFLHLARNHPHYKDAAQRKTDDYIQVSHTTSIAIGAKSTMEQIVRWLEDYQSRRGRPDVHDAPTTSSRSNGTAPSQHSGYEIPSLPAWDAGICDADIVALPRLPAASPLSRPAPQKTPSFPTTSIEDRLAALRGSGLAGATTSKPTRSPPGSPKRPSTPSRSPRQTAIPLSPTSRPPAETFPDTADDAAGRSGSAPPVLPYSKVQEAATVWEESALQFRQEGGTPIARTQKGVVDRGPAGGVGTAPDSRAPHSESTEPPSPTKFDAAFPSLDDFERSVTSAAPTAAAPASSSYSFPSVPAFDPSAGPSRPPRPPPPHPPKPRHLDERTFQREQQERADAMAKLAAGLGDTSISTAPSASVQPSLPNALVPGGGRAPSSVQSTSMTHASSPPAPLPPPATPSKGFKIPFSSEVRPAELWQYLQTSKAETGEGPRVLLLDLRSREEHERGRIRGETVCIEPIVLRPGIKSSEIENALSLSPPHEAALFAARNYYDVVVVYDRSSSALPSGVPTSTTSEAQRVLWTLLNAIYEREFSKPLQRQPLLLVGGWEAWEKKVGAQGSVGTGVQALRREAQDDAERAEAKKAHRKAALLPSNGNMYQAPMPNGAGMDRYGSTGTSSSSGYAPSSAASANGVSAVVSPRLAMPPVAAQRAGPAPPYDPFATSPHARPSYIQPQLDSYSLPTSPSSSPAAPRPRTDANGLYSSTQSFAPVANGDYGRQSYDYARPSIDYPQLQSRGPPPVIHPSRPAPPPPSSYAPVPAVPLARPPPAKPAPLRSNSSFSSMQPAQYSAADSRFPTSLMSFDEGVIGISGLKNLGNTCYMNSTIQCLSAAVPFARYFTGGGYRKDINTINPLGTKGALANAVAELIRALWAQQYHFLSPVTFRENICRVAPQFRGSDQHDAQEFLGFLLDGLHEDCNYVVHKPAPIEMTPEREHDLETLPPQVMSEREWQIYKMRNDSFIVQCFQGQFRNQLRCLTCQKTSTTYNTFMPLSVPIPGGRGISKVSLMACLETFVRDEILDKDDAWHCPRCKKNRKAVKKLSLSKLPPILVIHLKRFSFHGPFSDKIETQVQYPLAGLDLTAFLPPPLTDKHGQPMSPGPPKGYVYDLFGVTNHYGNLSSGHYTAYVRSGRDWYNIGDSKVTPCDPAHVQSAKSAYILYYTLRT